MRHKERKQLEFTLTFISKDFLQKAQLSLLFPPHFNRIKTAVIFISIAQEISTSNIISPFVIDLSSVFNSYTGGNLQNAMSFKLIYNSFLLKNATSVSKVRLCVSVGVRHAIGFTLRPSISEKL
jgi:hypothetical protein